MHTCIAHFVTQIGLNASPGATGSLNTLSSVISLYYGVVIEQYVQTWHKAIVFHDDEAE